MKIQSPVNVPLHQILPSEPLLLMGAGPVPIPHQVAQANGVVINHLGETMNKVIERVKVMSKYAFQTSSDHILGISGPASAAIEMAVSNLLGKGRKVLVLNQGTFSGRFAEMAERIGTDVTRLDKDNSEPFTLSEVEEAYQKNKFDVLTVVQGETSCGVKNIHLKEIAEFAKKMGSLVFVDAVCTLTTMPLMMDEWKLDVVVTGGQKGLSSIPGVSLIAFSNEAWDQIIQRKEKPTHWCVDALLADRFWTSQEYHYTAPVPGILAIHEALRLICLETLEKRFDRHFTSSMALQKSLEAMGLELSVPAEYRLNSVVAINKPEEIKTPELIKYMIQNFHVEISGAFGRSIVRIGQMGEQCRSQNLFKVVYATGKTFKHFGLNLNLAKGMSALEESLENLEY